METVNRKVSDDELRRRYRRTIRWHKGLSKRRWRELSFVEQMANVGSEVERAINWRDKDLQYSRMAAERALELVSLTIDDPKNKTGRLKELTRLYEFLVDYFFGRNQYRSSDEAFKKYFYSFNWAARANR